MIRIFLVLVISTWLFCLGAYSGRVQAENRASVSPRGQQIANLVEVEGHSTTLDRWLEIGSGFIVRYKGKSFVLTANHVVTPPLEVSKTFPNPKLMVNHAAEIPSIDKYRAKYGGKYHDVVDVERDRDFDLAWLKLPASGGLELGTNPAIETEVFMIGCPADVHQMFTRGMIEVYTPMGHVRSDCPGHYGSSGSALVTSDAVVVGMCQRFGVVPPAAGFYDFRPADDIRKFLDKHG